MKLNLISQMIHHYHKSVTENTDDYVDDYDVDNYDSEVEDPLGGDEGVTIYDRFDIDQDYGNYA